MPQRRVTVLVVDDHPFFRDGIEGMTTSIPDVFDLESAALYGDVLGRVFND